MPGPTLESFFFLALADDHSFRVAQLDELSSPLEMSGRSEEFSRSNRPANSSFRTLMWYMLTDDPESGVRSASEATSCSGDTRHPLAALDFKLQICKH